MNVENLAEGVKKPWRGLWKGEGFVVFTGMLQSQGVLKGNFFSLLSGDREF